MLPNLKHYHRPASPAEALRLLREPGSAPLAGGTHLLATTDRTLEQVVDLQDLDWRGIEAGGGWLRLGSLVTLAELEASARLGGAGGDLLRRAAQRAGPNTHRNAATLGGLIGARPAVSELLAALLVLGAEVEVAGAEPATRSLDAYLAEAAEPRGLTPAPTAEQVRVGSAGAIVATVRVPWPQEGTGAAEVIGRTPADAPIVHVAVWAAPGAVRVAAGGVGTRVRRLTAVEQALAQGVEAAVRATARLEPPGDFRGSTEYRRAMLGVLLRRALVACGAGG